MSNPGAPTIIVPQKPRSARKILPPVPQFADLSEKKNEPESPGKIVEERNEIDPKNKKPNIEQKSDSKKADIKPINTLSFPGQINLDLINKLYKQNKELQKDTHEKQETKASQAISINSLYTIKDEYDPARPNDYESIVQEREKLRLKEEEEERQREIERNRILEEEAQKINEEENPEGNQESEEISTEEKVLRMLEKQGWRMGEGNFSLGKFGQGMTTPLIAKKTASNTAIIVNSSVDMSAVLPPEVVAKKMRESLYNMYHYSPPTRVIVLLNMVTPEEVDESLQQEVAAECSNFGEVQDVVVVQLTNVPDEERIRIFVEFEKKENATTAFHNLYGRLFAGRTVIAKFYDENAFLSNQYYNPF